MHLRDKSAICGGKRSATPLLKCTNARVFESGVTATAVQDDKRVLSAILITPAFPSSA
jgi:hypothetical protein